MIISLSVFNNTLLVYAEDNTDFNIVFFDLMRDEKKIRSSAIQKDDVLYLSSKLLSDVSDFHYLPDQDKFIHDDAENNKGFREIWTVDSMLIVVSWLSALPVYQKTVTTSQPIEYNNDKYFSLADILPLLNVDAEIKDGALIISDIQHSLTDIFSKYDLGTTLFQTYDDSDFLGLSNEKILYGYSYFFTGLTDFAWKRLIFLPSGNWGKLEEYKEIFSSYLIDTETGLEEVIQDDNRELYSSLIDYHNSQDADKGETLSQSLDALGSYGEYEMKELLKKYPTMGGLDTDANRMILASKFSDMNQFNLRLLSCFAILNNYVKDHYEMLNSVYSLSGKNPYSVATKSVDKNAAKHIYNQYVENNVSQTLTYFFADELTDFAYKKITDAAKEKLLEETTGEALDKALMEIKLGSIISKLAFEGLAEVGLEVKSYEVAKRSKYLKHFNVLMETSSSQYYRYCNSGNISELNMNNIRLSAIMALLSSRSLYQAMADAQGVYKTKATYEHKRIDLINDALSELYLASNHCFTDSEEYIDQSISALIASVKTIKLFENQFSDSLNINATVFAHSYQSVDNSHSAAMYAESSSNSELLTTIPNGTIVTIISVPDNYQDGAMDHLMVLVDYNGQQGYVNSLCLRCDPNIDVSSYSQEQVLDLGKILFQECDCYSWMPVSTVSLLDYTSSDQYDGEYQKMLPAGLTISQLKDEFYKYFSSSIVGFIEGSFQEKDGYLWQITGYGDRIWLDHYEVKSVKSKSDTEIVYEVDEIIDPNFYDYYPPTQTFEFKIVNENGKWMLTIPDRYPDDLSSQANGQTTYEDIYGSYVFNGVNNTKGLYAHEDYIHQPTGYEIQQYFLEDINNDSIKELILEVTVAGTDETFRECYTYKDGTVKWVGTYDDIYMLKDCYLAKDGSGLVVIGWNGGTANPYIIEFRSWNPWDIKEQDHQILYVFDLPMIGDLASNADYVEEHTPYDSIPENIRSKLGIKLVAYSPADRSPLQELLSTGNQSQGNSSSVSDSYAVLGTVKTKGGDLNLRRSPYAEEGNNNTIAKMPNNSTLTILLPVFENDSDSNKDWYLVSYNNKIGYASEKYIQKTDKRVAFSENELLSIAKRLYYEADAADVWNYATCFDIDRSHPIPREEYSSNRLVDCYVLKGIKERDDFFNAIHKSFSSKYDQERVPDLVRGGFIGLGGLMNEYGELDSRYYPYSFDDVSAHQFYICASNWNKGDLLLSSISEPPYSAIQISSSDYSGKEIFFSGMLDFTQDAVIRDTIGNAGYDHLPVKDFSICFEDGRWKIGKFTSIRY